MFTMFKMYIALLEEELKLVSTMQYYIISCSNITASMYSLVIVVWINSPKWLYLQCFELAVILKDGAIDRK